MKKATKKITKLVVDERKDNVDFLATTPPLVIPLHPKSILIYRNNNTGTGAIKSGYNLANYRG